MLWPLAFTGRLWKVRAQLSSGLWASVICGLQRARPPLCQVVGGGLCLVERPGKTRGAMCITAAAAGEDRAPNARIADRGGRAAAEAP